MAKASTGTQKSVRSYLAERAASVPFSSIRQVFEKARRLEAEGARIARMEIGRPDFDTPLHIKEAAKRALDEGHVHYAPNRGIEPLREAIARKLERENGIAVDPATGVVVTVGCKEAIALTLLAYFEPGDEVIVPDPLWDTYEHGVRFVGATPISMPLDADDDFAPDLDRLGGLVTSRTKAIVLVSPSNPTGAVWSRDVLSGLASLAVKHDLLVIADEIYEKLVYGDVQHHSIATFPGMAERTITINGFSKAYAMDGWRIGYAAGPEQLIGPLVKVHQYTTNCVPTFLQHGAVAAYDGPQDAVEEMRLEFDRRRRMLVSRLKSMPGVEVAEPNGAFYVFPRFPARVGSGMELAYRLLQEAHVAAVPGDVFGAAGAGHVRLSYATSFDSIVAGMDRLQTWLERQLVTS